MNVKQIAMSFMGFVIRGVALVFIVMFIYKAGKTAYDFGYRIFTEEAMTTQPGRDVAITIVQGDSVLDVGEMLEEKGLIRDAKLFFVQKKCSVYDGDIKPGFYTLNTSMTADDMFAIIAGKKDGEDETDEEEAEVDSKAAPLTQAAPLVEQTGTGEWEGTEEDDSTATDDGEGDSMDNGIDIVLDTTVTE